jgi:hypothetical protein
MALRIRRDGRILCAATHPEQPGDTYLHDGISYRLTVQLRAIVTEPMAADPSNPGRGGHLHHGQWWWANEVPADVVLEQDWRDHEGQAVPVAPGACAQVSVEVK